MGRIFCVMGKSSTGKDTIYKKLLEDSKLGLKKIVLYTTRPIREGETHSVEYYFTTVEELENMKKENKIVECRSYNTIHGIWHYFTVKDEQINLEENNYLIIGTLESYLKTKEYFGNDKVLPIYIDIDDGERLSRALNRERAQKEPKYEELCRRFLADSADFSSEKLETAGINKTFCNDDLQRCIDEIAEYIVKLSDR